MRLINEGVITRFSRRHPDSRRRLEEWVMVTRAAEWRSIGDLQLAFPSADGGVRVASGARVTVFDVCGNKYRMITDIAYSIQTVTVLELMTHAQYSTDRWKRRY